MPNVNSRANNYLFFEGERSADGNIQYGYLQCVLGDTLISRDRRRTVLLCLGNVQAGALSGYIELYLLYPQSLDMHGAWFWKGIAANGRLAECFHTNLIRHPFFMNISQERLNDRRYELNRYDLALAPIIKDKSIYFHQRQASMMANFIRAINEYDRRVDVAGEQTNVMEPHENMPRIKRICPE